MTKDKEKEIKESKQLGFEDSYQEILSFKKLFSYFHEYIAHHQDSDVVFFFDIQGVLIKNNNFHEALASKKFEDRLRAICDDYEENYVKVARFGRFFKSKLTEDMLPIILNNLRDVKVELCLLTFARYSTDRETALKNHKVLHHFHKQIWTGGINKGLVMVEYLKSKKQLKDLVVIFIDDKLSHLKSVYDAIHKENKDPASTLHTTDLKLFLYNQDPVLPVTEQDFDAFWKNVIRHYKKQNLYNKKNKVANQYNL